MAGTKNPMDDLIKVSDKELMPLVIDNAAYLRVTLKYLSEIIAKQRGCTQNEVYEEIDMLLSHEREVIIDSLPKTL
jgi:hypothetical protein